MIKTVHIHSDDMYQFILVLQYMVGRGGCGREEDEECTFYVISCGYLVCIQDIQELTQKLRSAEAYRDKFLKFEADTDEMQDFTVQELAKVKHMVCLRP